jgi:Mrp family chromosome partitioning ATPase
MSAVARLRAPDPSAPSVASSGTENLMGSAGIEELKSVLRRSAVLIVVVVLIGVVAMNLVRLHGGPHYQAAARVLLNTGDLSSAALGINPTYQDPNRLDAAEQNLANSPELYIYAAQRANGKAGTPSQLRDATSATVANNVVAFEAKASNADRALLMVNTVASAYPDWRAQVQGRTIETAINQVNSQVTRFGKTPALEQQLQRLQVLKTLSTGATLFVERGTAAVKTAPKPVSDSLLGAALGLVVALLIVGGREFFDTRVRSESDVEDALDAPVLATIASLPRRMRTTLVSSGAGRFNDEYQLLAANIAQIFDGHEGTVQLAVTSALPGEGKTTTATNLAAALSRRGAQVVLADFDLRKPAVSEFVGIPRSAAGVSELLAGSAELRSVLWQVQPNGTGFHVDGDQRPQLVPARKRTGQSATAIVEGSLMVMPGGVVPRADSGLRFARLPSVLDRLPRELDFVVIDTPPALLVAGMAELAQSVDAVVVVVRYGYVHRRRLRSLGRQARAWRARVIGAVLNDSPGTEGYLNYYGRQ